MNVPYINILLQNIKESYFKGGGYDFFEDWGEELVNKKQPVVVLYDIVSDKARVLDGIPATVCPAKPIWSPDGTYIVGIAYDATVRRLGLVHCTNRLSTIFKLNMEGGYRKYFKILKSNVSFYKKNFK